MNDLRVQTRQFGHVTCGVRRMRERFEDAAVVEAARIRHAAQTPLTPAEERTLLFRTMLLRTRSWPAVLLAEIEHDLLGVSGFLNAEARMPDSNSTSDQPTRRRSNPDGD